MKPQEILDKYGKGGFYGQSLTRNSLNEYKDTDCIIASLTENIGFCFIIKTKKSYFSFYGVKNDIYFGGMGYNIRRCPLKIAVRLIENGGEILNQEEYNKMKDSILLEALD